jgi:uncharacterized protein (DUF1786 family)
MATPLRVLAVDVGTGTQDILFFESRKTIENTFRLIMPSPTVMIAEQIKRATAAQQPLLLTGTIMGGGPCHWAARDHARAGYAVTVSESAGRTFDDDLEMVRQMHFEVITDQQAEVRKLDSRYLHIEMQDFSAQAILNVCQTFGLSPEVDALAIAAFDHGAAPPGVSDRRFRFAFIEHTVHTDPRPSAFAYLAEQLPPTLTRLQAIAQSAATYIARSNSQADIPVLLMDTGSAAALGALEDPLVRQQRECILCNVGNFHTLAFHLLAGQIIGTFEHHTGELTRAQLEDLLRSLAAGTLTNDAVFHTSGHGALILPVPQGRTTDLPFLAVTGPRRELLRNCALPIYEAVPHGDMMIMGCFGLLRALADHVPALAEQIEASLLI